MNNFRAKAYWPTSNKFRDSIDHCVTLTSSRTTRKTANLLLDALIKAGCSGGHIEEYVEGPGWIVDAIKLEP